MKNSKFLILLLLFVAASTNVYAEKDSIIPLTAKTAWNLVYKQVELDYGVPPILFKAYPEKEIDANDTVLCSDTIYISGGLLSRYWNGKAYKWIFECRVPELSKDSMYKITAYLKLLNPVFIIKETIYKPITEYADTIGIAEDTWIDSDTLYKIPRVNKYSLHSRVSLERSLETYNQTLNTVWKMVRYDPVSGVMDSWLSLDALSGKILDEGVVSVSEPSISDGIIISPNPTSTSFSISGIDGVTSVKILTSLGMEVKQLSMINGQLSIDVSDLASGVYFVQFRSQTGVISKLIVVSR